MDAEALYRAVHGRDARFAGRFFLAVRTTRIYCRAGCPARAPKPENVQFFESAEAARAAGFRACLRCRPDAQAGSASLLGTGAVLARALRLLEETGEARGLAERLGVSERHLRRLFAERLGASPQEVLRARRLALARDLLAHSSLPMIDVALAAGFASLRRFNDAIKTAFHATPTALRGTRGSASQLLRGVSERAARTRAHGGMLALAGTAQLARRGGAQATRAAGDVPVRDVRAEKSTPATADAALRLRLPFDAPFDFEALLRFFSMRALPGVEQVTELSWRRTVREGFVEVRRADDDALEVLLPAALARQALQLAARTSRVFDLRAAPRAIEAHLAGDETLRPFLRPGVRVPGAWEPFEMAVRAVLGQQITVQAARRLAERLVREHGEALPHGALFPLAERLAEVELGGMPKARARTVRELARAVRDGRLRLDGTHGVRELRAIPGIGDWTAELIALRALSEPDAFPAADLGLCKALSLSPRALLAHAERWRPWRATAAAAIWLYEPREK